MKVSKILPLLIVSLVSIGLIVGEGEAAEKLKLDGLWPFQFMSYYRTRQPIKIEESVSLYVIGWHKVDKGKNYEFAFNFVAEPESDGTMAKIEGMSLYVFSSQPDPLVRISYENANQWTNITVYEPRVADQIIEKHGGPNLFYGLNYAWMINANFLGPFHDLGVVYLKTPAENRLKFVVETYVLDTLE